MANLILNGSTSGSITLAAPAVSGTTTLTLPATSGTVITTGSTFAGTGPAFSAYQNVAQTGIVIYTWTKVTLDTEEYDTNNNFASSRFTPTVAGYYQFNASLVGQTTTTTYGLYGAFYKNGTIFKYTTWANANGGAWPQSTGSALIYLNGSTDYVELYVYSQFGGNMSLSTTGLGGATGTYLQGFLARSA